jgi:hypothetical protein
VYAEEELMKYMVLVAAVSLVLLAGCPAPPMGPSGETSQVAPGEPTQAHATGEEKLRTLLLQIRDRNLRTREAAVRELGELGDRRAILPLIDVMDDENFISAEAIAWEAIVANYRITVAGALRKITGQDFGTDSAQWKAWYEENR